MLHYTNRHRRAISGAGLAQLQRRMSAAERACFAADVIDGKIMLAGLTVKSIAALVGVCPAYVHRALNLTPEQRIEVRRGDRPLVRPHCAPLPTEWDELVKELRLLGTDRALDAAVEAERANTSLPH